MESQIVYIHKMISHLNQPQKSVNLAILDMSEF